MEGPRVEFRSLDTVWVQVTGTLCNIACRHCFVSAGPKSDSLALMPRAQVEAALAEGAELGARDAYFTGGEPFLHPEIRSLVDFALQRMPLTILTNALLIDEDLAGWIAGRFSGSRYSFDLRVSLDGTTAERNDRVRGRGVFDGVVAALGHLARVGVSPVVTVVEHEEALKAAEARTAFTEFLRGLGLPHPRVKFLPLLRIGREERRSRGYLERETLGPEPLALEVEESLICSSSRTVTARGVMTCPILVEVPEARLGDSLRQAERAIQLRWRACHTCVVEGLRCAT
jgi:sulfatase maturation enzyme AslB (radical SAM superfamily)